MFNTDYGKRGQMKWYLDSILSQKGISSIKEQRQQTIILDIKDTDGFINIHIFYYLFVVCF